MPGIFDLRKVCCDNGLRLPHLKPIKAYGDCERC